VKQRDTKIHTKLFACLALSIPLAALPGCEDTYDDENGQAVNEAAEEAGETIEEAGDEVDEAMEDMDEAMEDENMGESP